jgi:hypothetical protein
MQELHDLLYIRYPVTFICSDLRPPPPPVISSYISHVSNITCLRLCRCLVCDVVLGYICIGIACDLRDVISAVTHDYVIYYIPDIQSPLSKYLLRSVANINSHLFIHTPSKQYYVSKYEMKNMLK